MNISKQIIIFIGFTLIVSVQSNFHNRYAKSYVRNIEKSIIRNCNKFALNKTNDYDIYNCISNNNANCADFKNYTNFINIKNECIKNIRSYNGMSILIVVFSWLFISISMI